MVWSTSSSSAVGSAGCGEWAGGPFGEAKHLRVVCGRVGRLGRHTMVLYGVVLSVGRGCGMVVTGSDGKAHMIFGLFQ